MVHFLGVLGAWGIWAAWPPKGWVAVIVAVLPWVAEWIKIRKMPRFRAADVALLAFMLSAGVGVWAGYDRSGSRAIFPAYPMGWTKLWGLGLAVLLYTALATLPTEAALHSATALLAGWGAAAAALFSIAYIGIAPTALSRCVDLLIPNSNIIAGVVGPLLILEGGMLLAQAGKKGVKGRSGSLFWGLLTGTLMLIGLSLTGSRGTWLALGVAVGLTVLWQLTRRCRRAWQRFGLFILCLAAALGIAGWLAVRSGLWVALLHHPDIANRLWIFLRGLLLVRDYPFSGGVLGHCALLDSTYAQLIHVPTLPYSHALLLDVAVEQGLGGALVMFILWLGTLWRGMWALTRSEKRQPLLGAALLALVVIIIHGLGDDALYSSRWSVFLWMPMGIIVAAERQISPSPTWQRRLEQSGMLIFGVAIVVTLFMMRQVLIPAWYANLGAVAQTRIELPWYNYQHFDSPTLDQIRQQADFDVAKAYFNLALSFDPGQVTARTRLAHIALARGDYATALAHSRAAWEAGHHDRITSLLLSDALAAQGKVAQAAALAQGRTWAPQRLEGQAFYRYQRYHDQRRARYARHTARLLAMD